VFGGFGQQVSKKAVSMLKRERDGSAVRREGDGLAWAMLLHFAVRQIGDVREAAMPVMVVEGKSATYPKAPIPCVLWHML
jgi:hypothetical protein